MKYLLDTHAAIWLLEGSDQLGVRARDLLAMETAEAVGISDISLLETALLAHRGRVQLSPAGGEGLASFASHLSVLPINPAIARDAVSLALPQADPFDRVITATARYHGVPLITRDRRITEAGVVETLW